MFFDDVFIARKVTHKFQTNKEIDKKVNNF